ncbi:MAG: nuclear transport factor 2 family protein [Acidobacteriaceae bacterium]|nr:nuclear transport factor 2 family protein [Acidobacteriaceae bacterium]
MRFCRSMACVVLVFSAAAFAQTPVQTKDKAAIEQVLRDQQAAWNQGDIDVFMRGYLDSPDTTFIGKTISHGYQPILERYKKGYSSRAAMGTLEFSELSVRMLGNDHAVVTGRYHLTRTQEGGGDASGIFSLVFERESDGWKIILDHTS